MKLNKTVATVTGNIRQRSLDSREAYLGRMQDARREGPGRNSLSCGNLAHGYAACSANVKKELAGNRRPNIAVITAYNDMLSAHQPYKDFPDRIKEAAWEAGGVAQVAGGVPAMCDGVTQGQPGMELSLYSRDVIAMATAVSLSHNMFDGALFLGICDKIVPGLLMGALTFGHLPTIFIPAGPMNSGLSNAAKSRVRQQFAEGKVGRDELLEAESRAYHSPGTCTFYGTANTNQLIMEFMGLHLPGASFINPGTPLRIGLTEAAAKRAVAITDLGSEYIPLYKVFDEKALVNGIVGLLASGGSTNHTIHLVAIAKAAGIQITWDDFQQLSTVVPLMARVYPNGQADINHFQAAGGVQFMLRELLDAGLLHADVNTVVGQGLERFIDEPFLDGDVVTWRQGASSSHDRDILRGTTDPFDTTGGLIILDGNLGRAVIKVSSVEPQHRYIEAPARVFTDQNAVVAAFEAGELNRDIVVVVIHQGPRANGMPELHKLTPCLSVLQKQGHQVALVTDGRMSGASGKVPAAIHVTPEASAGGMLGRIRDGDMISLDANAARLDLQVETNDLSNRDPVLADHQGSAYGFGRELFSLFRDHAGSAETGGSPIIPDYDPGGVL